MHALKIAETLEHQSFEGCKRGIFRKLSSYYIHHFNTYKKSGYNIPTDEKKGGYNIPAGVVLLVGILYPPRHKKKAGIIYPPEKAYLMSKSTTR